MAKLLQWGIFSVLISLVPFAFVFLGQLLDPALHICIPKLWPHGELLLVSTALAADGVGDIIGATNSNSDTQLARIWSGGLCMLVIFLSAMVFAAIQEHTNYSPSYITGISLVLFAATLTAGFNCKRLAEAANATKASNA